ncbi:hypothetical protein PoB_000383100 [Plakobranchus ocellatus]|uniref:Uncharacterized protein n=1 Tax=Plakobranchus ocellatus TaxID=259542 RepID=A0AAV3Y2E6_9GAST|nr:hypothetical protein PoB_000383100 [Plakobranchus ocellatus]
MVKKNSVECFNADILVCPFPLVPNDTFPFFSQNALSGCVIRCKVSRLQFRVSFDLITGVPTQCPGSDRSGLTQLIGQQGLQGLFVLWGKEGGAGEGKGRFTAGVARFQILT